jgi:hypothetical protein
MASQFSVELRGMDALDKLIDQVSRRAEPAEVREALRPAAGIIQAAVIDEAPELSGKLKKSVVVRSSRRFPVVMVAVDRKKALRISRKYQTGFPYVNSIISEKRRGNKADKFVARGFDKSAEAAADKAIADIVKVLGL